MSVVNCWNNIIGLSNLNCDCYTPPVDYDVSQSGLYITDYLPVEVVSKNICDTTFWDTLERIRLNATNVFLADSQALLMNNYKLKRDPYIGGIGNPKNTNTMSLTAGKYAGCRIWCSNVRSGIFKITEIGTIFNQTGVIDVSIYNNLNELIDTIQLNTTANVFTRNIVDIELPLSENNVDNLEYYFIYQIGSNQPKNNAVKCNCGGIDFKFNRLKPYTHVVNYKGYEWAQWVMVGGYYGDSLDFMNLTDCADNNLFGLTFGVEIKCKLTDVICKDSFDFDTNFLARASALAILHKSCDMVLGDKKIMSSFNRDDIINQETYDKERYIHQGKYTEMIKYITRNISITGTDCLDCRGAFDAKILGLMA